MKSYLQHIRTLTFFITLQTCHFAYSEVDKNTTQPIPKASKQMMQVNSPQASMEKLAVDKKDLKSLFFDVVDRELKYKKILFTFDMQSTNGQSLQFQNITFNTDTIKGAYKDKTLSLNWNSAFIPQGELSIIDRTGKEKYRKNISALGQWEQKLSEEDEKAIFSDLSQFRFCLRNQKGENYIAICSRWYGVERRSNGFFVGLANVQSSPRVIFQQEEERLKMSREVQPNEPIQFYANIATGDSLEFRTLPQLPKIFDAVEVDQQTFQLSGQFPAPLNHEYQVMKGELYSNLTLKLGFQKTIDEKPDYWTAKVPYNKSELLLPGIWGGFFVVQLEVNNLPTEAQRMSTQIRETKDSYKSEDKIKVYDEQLKESIWKISLPNKFTQNKNSYLLKSDRGEHAAYLMPYRGAPGSASIRLTGVATTSSELLIFGEAHLSYWFNDLFGWDQYFLSKQRWGASAKYFTSFVELKQVEEGKKNLSVTQADIRYRFTPGLWERDESVGLILSMETVEIAELNVPKMGAGLFWARSMPQIFDKYFSMLPYMKYPKWVDMEFIRYFSTSNSDVALGDDYIINFHGKVLWSQNIFGEAGFGIKNYFVQSKIDEAGVKLTTFYGTVGLGINF